MARSFLALRSLVFYFGFALSNIIFGSLSCIFAPFVPTRIHQEIVTFGNFIALVWLRITCGICVEVHGYENLSKQPAVYLSNHESTWETFYLQRLLRPVSTIVKKELLLIPFFGWGLYFMKPIAIDRSSPKDALKKVMQMGIKRLAGGNNVLIYPAGSRHTEKARASYARSGAAIAVKAEVPIIPIAHNASLCWPGDSFIKQPGTITLVIGNPLNTDQLDSRTLTKSVQNWVETQRANMP